MEYYFLIPENKPCDLSAWPHKLWVTWPQRPGKKRLPSSQSEGAESSQHILYFLWMFTCSSRQLAASHTFKITWCLEQPQLSVHMPSSLSLSCAPWFPDSVWSSTQLMCADRDRVVLAKLAMLKYVHVLLPATQCESVNAQSCVCGAQLFSASDQQSGWAAARSARIKMQCVWITAVCLWGGHVHGPEPPQREYLGLHWYACYPNLTFEHREIPHVDFSNDLWDQIKLFSYKI